MLFFDQSKLYLFAILLSPFVLNRFICFKFKRVLFPMKCSLKFLNFNSFFFYSSASLSSHKITRPFHCCLIDLVTQKGSLSLILCANIAQHELRLPLSPILSPSLYLPLSFPPFSLHLSLPSLVLANHCAMRREICKQCLLKQPKSMQRARAR